MNLLYGRHPIGWFFFLLSQIVSACDIMIHRLYAYRLSGAKLIVYEKNSLNGCFFDVKGTKQAFLKEIYDLRAKTLCDCRVALDVFAPKYRSLKIRALFLPFSSSDLIDPLYAK